MDSGILESTDVAKGGVMEDVIPDTPIATENLAACCNLPGVVEMSGDISVQVVKAEAMMDMAD